MRHTTLAASGAALAALVLGSAACGPRRPLMRTRISRLPFGTTADAKPVELFTLTNAHDVEVRAMTYCATIVYMHAPHRECHPDDIVLGYPALAGYLAQSPYFGAIVGRYGNRIANGRFTLDGQTYQLATNNGPNHLHGGVKGFDSLLWRAEPFDHDGNVGVVYSLTSRNGDEGYPGTVNARVTYTLTPSNELMVEYEATSDRLTPINLTQHSFFNLAGEGRGDVLGHRLTIAADRFTPVDKTLIPTGELASVAGTPFDFRQPTPIGARISADHDQLHNGTGYDHNWVLNRTRAGLVPAAHLEHPATGRT